MSNEPVAWMDSDGDVYKDEPPPNWCPPHTPLYTQDDTALLRQALEALETEADHPGVIDEQAVNDAITALRERLGEKT